LIVPGNKPYLKSVNGNKFEYCKEVKDAALP
jgi:hypothetical protein